MDASTAAMYRAREERVGRRTAIFQNFRNATEVDLRHVAAVDAMTNAYNRDFGLAHIEDGMTVLLLDLDKFKSVNDTMGHRAGDDVLTVIVGRLLEECYEVIRLGGDEFVVTVRVFDIDRQAKIVADIEDLLTKPIELSDGRTAQVGVSIGAAFHMGNIDDTLLRADREMYEVKAFRRTESRSKRRAA